MQFTIIDIILLAVFAVIVFIAAKKGFAKSLLEFAAVIAAVFLAYQFSPAVSSAVYDSVVEKSLVSTVQEQLENGEVTGSAIAQQAVNIIDDLPDTVVSIAESVGVDVAAVRDGLDFGSVSEENAAQTIVEKVAQPVVVPAITAIAFILLAVLLIVLLRVAASLISKVFELPVVGTLNTGLGIALGALKGFIVVLFLCAVLGMLFSGSDTKIGEAVSGSFFVNLFKDFVSPLKD